ncbi:c-type cytochrome [Paenibacillus paeoniae]|uniref:Cytochrome c n=1 Tax=Paenibacillus paeoniae TaxID=2292705 RepID=A0A371P5C2_9BACL|nr:cytochrome c [Paenibacillus paeoniae]REK71144.1 cytochrome c [Paenibacillus paeoniae]
MTRNSKWLLLVVAVILVIAVSACGGGVKEGTNSGGTNNGTNNGGTNGGNNAGGGTVDAAAAEAIYKQNCIGCHAVDLSGGVGPNLQKVGAKLSADQIKATITNGRGGMPAYKDQLSSADIDTLSNWLASMK